MSTIVWVPRGRRSFGLWNFKTLLPIITSLFFAATGIAEEINLPWLATNMQKKLGAYAPQRLELSPKPPAGLKKAPENLAAPLYGTLRIGPKESPASLVFILDEPDDKPAQLFVDANGNGDFADDAPATWKERKIAAANGMTNRTYFGDVTVKIPYPNRAADAHLFMYRFDKNDPARAAYTNSLFYYRDYGRSGEVKLSDKSYHALLVDDSASGDFRGAAAASRVNLLLDLDNDQKFDMRRESFSIKQPFNISGTTWEITGMTADGRFNIVKSSRTVPEPKPVPNLGQGAKAKPFTAKTTDGKTVRFPDDFKGKVVLLDFWATWCGPCIQEIPNVVKNYQQYHPQGLEILGISLDQANAAAKLASFTKQKAMPWRQVYDGKYWQAEVAQLYGIDAIPRMLLVDGDTGEIFADNARGEQLGPAIQKALAGKRAK